MQYIAQMYRASDLMI